LGLRSHVSVDPGHGLEEAGTRQRFELGGADVQEVGDQWPVLVEEVSDAASGRAGVSAAGGTALPWSFGAISLNALSTSAESWARVRM
jgi:hypothetical protein